MLVKCIAGIIMACLIFIIFSPCSAAPLNHYVVEGVGDFFRQPPGTFAFLPNITTETAAKSTVIFSILPENGTYRIPKQSHYYFVINHMDQEASSAVLYLGIETLKIFDYAGPPETSIHLYRNAGWERYNDQNYLGKNAVGKSFPNRTIRDFTESHCKTAKCNNVDRIFFKWHGQPIGSQIDSWNQHTLWLIPDLASFITKHFSPLPREYCYMLNASLIRFEKTKKYNSSKRMIYKFNGNRVIAAYLKVFAPNSPDFYHFFYLIFD